MLHNIIKQNTAPIKWYIAVISSMHNMPRATNNTSPPRVYVPLTAIGNNEIQGC